MIEITHTVTILIVFAVLIQFCVDRVKEIVGGKVLEIVKAPVWALAFGLLFAILFQLDMFAMLGLPASVPMVARLMTGLVISAGAAPVHELIERLRQSRISDENFLNIGKAMVDETAPTQEVSHEKNLD